MVGLVVHQVVALPLPEHQVHEAPQKAAHGEELQGSQGLGIAREGGRPVGGEGRSQPLGAQGLGDVRPRGHGKYELQLHQALIPGDLREPHRWLPAQGRIEHLFQCPGQLRRPSAVETEPGEHGVYQGCHRGALAEVDSDTGFSLAPQTLLPPPG